MTLTSERPVRRLKGWGLGAAVMAVLVGVAAFGMAYWFQERVYVPLAEIPEDPRIAVLQRERDRLLRDLELTKSSPDSSPGKAQKIEQSLKTFTDRLEQVRAEEAIPPEAVVRWNGTPAAQLPRQIRMKQVYAGLAGTLAGIVAGLLMGWWRIRRGQTNRIEP